MCLNASLLNLSQSCRLSADSKDEGDEDDDEDDDESLCGSSHLFEKNNIKVVFLQIKYI